MYGGGGGAAATTATAPDFGCGGDDGAAGHLWATPALILISSIYSISFGSMSALFGCTDGMGRRFAQMFKNR